MGWVEPDDQLGDRQGEVGQLGLALCESWLGPLDLSQRETFLDMCILVIARDEAIEWVADCPTIDLLEVLPERTRFSVGERPLPARTRPECGASD